VIAVHKLTGAIRSLRIRTVTAQWRFTLGASAMLVALAFAVRLDGTAHADWLQFIGRFHPLLLHLPIGMLVLLPVLELAGTTRLGLREAAGFVLYLVLVTGAITLVLGILLAYGSGVTGATVTRHMWGGIALLIGLVACVSARPAWVSGQSHRVYPALLAVTLLTLTWTAHQGGSLTHGSDYLTRHMPGPLRRFIPAASGASDAAYVGSVYLRNVHPIFDAKCVACHGTGKEQAGLRLDFYDLLMKGGRDGAVIVPRNPDQSVLLQRVTLSPTDRHFMPADGRTPLTVEEIAVLRAWILAGASPTAVSIREIPAAVESNDVPLRPVGDYSYLMNEIHQMQRLEAAKLVPVSANPSDGLILRTIDVASKFEDADLANFQRFGPYIVEVELGRTSVSDACFEILDKFTNLRVLHLEDTGITGQGLAKLSSLSQLTYLNLSGTKVTTGALAAVKDMPNLHHIYLFGTPAEAASPSTDDALKNTR
jgi:uncharacterized membrane protein